MSESEFSEFGFYMHLTKGCFFIPYIAPKSFINALFRRIDDSACWPIRGRFNATERAIRRLRRMGAFMGKEYDPVSYTLALDNEISFIVNNAA